MVYVEIAVVFILVCVNGLLAMSELAVVSARPARLKTMIDRNVRGAGRALELGANPGRFLSTVQIGITLVGVLSGAFSGATLGGGGSVGKSRSRRQGRLRLIDPQALVQIAASIWRAAIASHGWCGHRGRIAPAARGRPRHCRPKWERR